MTVPEYVQLKSDEPLPTIDVSHPFLAIVCIEMDDVSEQWRSEVSAWLVENGCRYAIAWGASCSLWEDAIDDANLAAFDYAEIPEDNFVMTTWHKDQELPDVFWFAKNAAKHSSIELNRRVLIHISEMNRKTELLRMWNGAEQA